MKRDDFDIKIFKSRFSSLLEQSNENTHTLAKKLDLSPATISRYANGVMIPKLITLYAIADIFNVNPLWLMGLVENMHTENNITPLPSSTITEDNSYLPVNNEDTSCYDVHDKNTIKIAGRDGSYLERRLTDDQLDLIKKMIDQMPEADEL